MVHALFFIFPATPHSSAYIVLCRLVQTRIEMQLSKPCNYQNLGLATEVKAGGCLGAWHTA